MEHPAIMFEIMAINQANLIAFYTSVFGWQIQEQGGFAYIHFKPAGRQLLGGIGQALPGVVGRGKGIAFYIQVASLKDTLQKVKDHGGAVTVEPITIDGYHFAMFDDPECNQIGIIEPFGPSA